MSYLVYSVCRCTIFLSLLGSVKFVSLICLRRIMSFLVFFIYMLSYLMMQINAVIVKCVLKVCLQMNTSLSNFVVEKEQYTNLHKSKKRCTANKKYLLLERKMTWFGNYPFPPIWRALKERNLWFLLSLIRANIR